MSWRICLLTPARGGTVTSFPLLVPPLFSCLNLHTPSRKYDVVRNVKFRKIFHSLKNRKKSKIREHHAVARLTRFEGRGHTKFPKGPPFAYVFWKSIQRVPPLLTFFEKVSKGSPLCLRFLKKFQKKLSKGGALAFLSLDLTGGHGPLALPPPR